MNFKNNQVIRNTVQELIIKTKIVVYDGVVDIFYCLDIYHT